MVNDLTYQAGVYYRDWEKNMPRPDVKVRDQKAMCVGVRGAVRIRIGEKKSHYT